MKDKMKIELEEPFKSIWKSGYIVVSNQRKSICLFNNSKDRTTISYARYLMGVKLGYEVPDHLEVDHRDDDKTNDDINNLQLLTTQENIDKENKRRAGITVPYQNVVCKKCSAFFTIDTSYYNKKIKAGNKNIFCTESCRSKFNSVLLKPPTNKTSDILINKITEYKKLGFSVKETMEKIGLSKSTINNYRNPKI